MFLLDPFMKPQISVYNFHRQLIWLLTPVFEGVWSESIHIINVVPHRSSETFTCQGHSMCKKVAVSAGELLPGLLPLVWSGVARRTTPRWDHKLSSLGGQIG